MLSLVNYGSSEESEDEENCDNHEQVQSVPVVSSINEDEEGKFNDEEWNSYQTKEDKNSDDAISKPVAQSQLSLKHDNESSTPSDDILSKLPPPVSDLRSIPWDQLSKLSYKSRAIRIMAPSIPEDSEEKKEKKIPSKTGSGLLAMLPKPKNEFVAKPYSLKKPTNVLSKNQTSIQNKPKLIPKPKLASSAKMKEEHKSDSDGEDEDVDFFSLSTPSLPVVHNADSNVKDSLQTTNVPVSSTEVSLADVPMPTEDIPYSKPMAALPPPQQPNESFFLDTDASKNNQMDLTSSYNYVSFQQPNDELQLDQEALAALCGRRGLKRRAANEDEFKVIDINSSELNPDSQELLTKNLTSELPRPSHKSKDGPTSQQKRKHQIIYLAHQAKEQELELQNTWANNRMTKKQTQAKYGF